MVRRVLLLLSLVLSVAGLWLLASLAVTAASDVELLLWLLLGTDTVLAWFFGSILLCLAGAYAAVLWAALEVKAAAQLHLKMITEEAVSRG